MGTPGAAPRGHGVHLGKRAPRELDVVVLVQVALWERAKIFRFLSSFFLMNETNSKNTNMTYGDKIPH